jgi:hypothetical protein
MIRRLAFWWSTRRDRRKPSGRDWARQLGISHTWLQKLVWKFTADPGEMWRLQVARGDPQSAELISAQEYIMKEPCFATYTAGLINGARNGWRPLKNSLGCRWIT